MNEFQPKLVSVIVPTYNRADLLREAVQSLIKQTYRPLQCIIVDDGSIDNTADIIREFNKQEYQGFSIQYLVQPNSGSQVARNKGTELASGEYIQYLDSDDLLYPTKLQEQVAYLRQHPKCDAVFGDWESGSPVSKSLIKGYISQDFIRQMLTLERSIHTSAILFRKSTIDLIGPWDVEIRRCQEIDFHLRGILAGAVYHYQPLVTGLWRYHEEDRIHNQTGVYEFVGFYRKWEQILTDKGLFTSEMAEKIADWYFWFLTQSKQQDAEKLLVVLGEAVRLKPSLSFYISFKMRLLRLFFGKKRALKIWLLRYLQAA